MFRDILGGGRKQVIRLTVGREGERGEVEHDKIIEGGSNFLLGIE